MFFTIEPLGPDDPRQISHQLLSDFGVGRQAIFCDFADSSRAIYTHGELEYHRALYIRELQSWKSTPDWQEACSEYQRQYVTRSEHALLVEQAITHDLRTIYPGMQQHGFDFGVAVMPTREDGRLLQKGVLLFDIFPRRVRDVVVETNWPYAEPAPFRITMPIGEHIDPTGFYGLLNTAIACYNRKAVAIELTDVEAWKQRMDYANQLLGKLSPTFFFISDRYKHAFLHHTLCVMGQHIDRVPDDLLRSVVRERAPTSAGRQGDNILEFRQRSRSNKA